MKTKLLEIILAVAIGIISSNCSNPMGYEDKLNTKWITPEGRREVKVLMQQEASKLQTLNEVRKLQEKFRYRDEKKQWNSTIETLFYHNFYGDCEEAALLGIWSLDKISIPAREVLLYDSGIDLYHSICMSNDNHIFITNNYVVEIDGGPDEWKKAVFSFPFFKENYDIIIDGRNKYYREEIFKS